MKEIGPFIYQDKFLIVQAGFHTHTLDIEILYGQANDQKHQ